MIVRLRYSKLGKIRWISHRDGARVWERALRRAGLPVAYSQGFSPRPKLSFGLALPTGYESWAEYLDVSLQPEGPVDLASLPAHLTHVLPSGMAVHAAEALDAGADSLQQVVTSCSWRLAVDGLPLPAVEDHCARLLEADHVLYQRERKGKVVTDDLRPCLLSLNVSGEDDGVVGIDAELTTQPRAVKPSELIAALGPALYERPGCRTHQWIARDGARREPIEVPTGATDAAPHAQERAS